MKKAKIGNVATSNQDKNSWERWVVNTIDKIQPKDDITALYAKLCVYSNFPGVAQKKAEDLYQELKDKEGTYLKTIGYSNMMKMYCILEQWDKVVDIHSESKSNGVKTTDIMFEYILLQYQDPGRVETALDFVVTKKILLNLELKKYISRKGLNWPPSAEKVIQASIKKMGLESVDFLWMKMLKLNLLVEKETIDIFLDAVKEKIETTDDEVDQRYWKNRQQITLDMLDNKIAKLNNIGSMKGGNSTKSYTKYNDFE